MRSIMTVALYRQMLLIRILEEEIQLLCDKGQGFDAHFNTGQEAIAVGACAALEPTDYIVAHHRTIAHAVAKGVPLYPLVAELLGKSTGIAGGLAGEMHLSYPAKRFMFSFQLVGTSIPVAAGLAWAVKNYLKTQDVVAVFFGDAATSNGQWHEGVTLAALHNLPLLLLCENNHLAGNVRPDKYLPTKTVVERASAYGITGMLVDGNRVEQVVDAVKAARNFALTKSRPVLIEFDTTRLGRHKQGQGDIRTPEELAELWKRDPLAYEEKRLGIVPDDVAKMKAETRALVLSTIERALADGVNLEEFKGVLQWQDELDGFGQGRTTDGL